MIGALNPARANVTNRTLMLAMTAFLGASSALVTPAFEIIPSAMIAIGYIGGLVLVSRDAVASQSALLAKRVDARTLATCMAGAGALLFYGGALNILHATEDWLVRGAVLADIASVGFPVSYKLGETDVVLRAPIGMYLLPGFVGRIGGLGAAHAAMWLQNSIALGVILYFFAILGQGKPHAFLMLASGPCVLLPLAILLYAGAPIDWSAMRRFSFDAWHPEYQFTSAVNLYFWVPNHAIPGWWLAILALLYAQREAGSAGLILAGGFAMFWSPLVILAIPVLMAGRLREHIVDPSVWLAGIAVMCFLPLAAFLVSGSGQIPRGAGGAFGSLLRYFVFLSVLAPHSAFLIVYRDAISPPRRALVVVCLLMLVAAPFVRFGSFNEIVMRGCIVPLAILWFVFADVLLRCTAASRPAAVAGWLIAMTCSTSGMVALAAQPFKAAWRINDCSTVQMVRDIDSQPTSPHYHASWESVPSWLLTDRARLRPVDERTCWDPSVFR